jgi:hypothetical protein
MSGWRTGRASVVTGPIVHPLVGRGRVWRRLGPLLCRRLGCCWEVRQGYDWCPRCGASEWHLTRPSIA